jgi:phage major head subunit gpT-like protein
MPFDRVGLFTQALNAAFVKGYDAIAEPAPIEAAMTIVPSNGRIENYPWLHPPPLMRQWEGFRRYAKLGETNYRVPNKTYTAEFEVPLEDLDDDQIEGFKLQAAAMGKGAAIWPGIEALNHLANGQTTPCFDDTNFFASTHTIGVGNNVFTAVTADSSSTHAMIALVVDNTLIRPLLWQRREGPDFRTDAGDNDSSKVRMVHWWSDLRGAPGYGFWWDVCLCKFTGVPTVTEMQTALGTINARLRSFKYPKSLADDRDQYPHGQKVFSENNVIIVCSTLIEHIARQALTLSLVAQTENYWKGWARLICSGYLDGIT